MTKQRQSSWIPVIVSNRGNQTGGDKMVRQAHDAIAAPLAALYVTYVDGSLEETTKVSNQKIERRADLRFALGIALALALPAFIGFGVYVVAESLILTAS